MNPPNTPSGNDWGAPRYDEPLPGLETASAPDAKPPVITWYRAYCILMAVLYVAGFAGSVALLIFRAQLATSGEISVIEITIRAALLMVLCLVMFAFTVAALFLPRRPWAWIYHLVNIALGLTGCCFFLTIPLLIFWLKPETQAYFGRAAFGSTPPSDPDQPLPPIPRA